MTKTTLVAHTTIKLSDSLRAILKRMNFHDIPEEANYIAFFDDGECIFLESVSTDNSFAAMFGTPNFVMFQIYDQVEVEID